jgi:hypothetical protein
LVHIRRELNPSGAVAIKARAKYQIPSIGTVASAYLFTGCPIVKHGVPFDCRKIRANAKCDHA